MPILGEMSDGAGNRTDRKLGEEWEDWDGSLAGQDSAAPVSLFVTLAGAVAMFFAACGWAAAWLVAPRLQALGWQTAAWWLAWAWTTYLCAWFAGVLLGAAGVKGAVPWLRALGGIRWVIAPSVVIARRFGVTRDRVGHAFVRLHNRLEKLPPVVGEPNRLLVLVPRCLNRETLQGLTSLRSRYGFTQMTAAGGTEARRSIAQMRPRGIVAVACERDLLSGVRDLRGRIPVLAICNQRPEGPCKNTRVDLHELEGAVKMFLQTPA